MRVHVSQSDDFVAEMAFGRTTAVGDFVWSQTAGEEDVGGFGRRIVWALLRDLEVAESAEDEFPGADCCAVVGELWGDLAAHCPFCHGHEFTGRRIGILGAAPGAHLSRLLGPICTVAPEHRVAVPRPDSDLPQSAQRVGTGHLEAVVMKVHTTRQKPRC